MKWPTTPVSERLGITYPILQGPLQDMATPELVAAVSSAGGLGILDAGNRQPGALRDAIREIRQRTDRPFGVELVVPSTAVQSNPISCAIAEKIRDYRRELGVSEPLPLTVESPRYTEQLGLLFEEAVPIVVFSGGVPGATELESLKQQDVMTVGTATHLLEALVLEESGVDVVIAQGQEAGGSRATFVGDGDQTLIGTMALVPLLVDHLNIPVIACGGLMDGRGIVAVLALGAAGAQLSTAFLATPESGIDRLIKKRLIKCSELSTTISPAFTGRAARVVRNRWVEEMAQFDADSLKNPDLDQMTLEVRQAAAQRGDLDLVPIWAGQGCTYCDERSAPDLISSWVAQVNALLLGRRRIAGTVRPSGNH